MAKLYFRYGAMNSGKSTGLLQAAFNYEERGHRVLLLKPKVDTKGADSISSRLGMDRRVDILLDAHTSPRAAARALAEERGGVSCLLVDEAQFLEPWQVDDLFRVAVLDGVPVLCYGIRTDFNTNVFPGSGRLLAVAHSVEELKTICRCGRKAVLNARIVGGAFTFGEGDQVAIDQGDVTYESLCGQCYLRESGDSLPSDAARE